MRIFWISSICMLAAVAALNYSVDVAGEWHATAHGVSLPKSGSVPVPENFNERMLRAEMIESLGKPDVAVLGSSRAFGFSAAHFDPNLSVLNLSVPHADFRDFMGLWQSLKERGSVPATVILAVDPWMFNANSNDGDFRWKKFAPQVARFEAAYSKHRGDASWPPSATTLQRLRWTGDSWTGLLNWELLVKSSGVVWGRSFSPETGDGDASPSLRRLFADGSYNFVQSSPYDFSAELKKVDANPTMVKNWALDEGAVRQLAALLKSIREAGSTPVLLVGPVHSDFYSVLEEKFPRVIPDVELALEKVSFETACNAFAPAKAGCGSEDFGDFLHFSPACVTKILRFCEKKSAGLNKILPRP